MEIQLRHHVLAARSVSNNDPTTNGVVNSDKNILMHMSQAREQFSNTREGFGQQVQFQTGTGRAEARVNAAKSRRNSYWIGDTFQNIIGWPSGRVCVIAQTAKGQCCFYIPTRQPWFVTSTKPGFLNRRSAARYRALASITLGRERFSWN
jgi:hypothetical protein